MGLQLGKLKFLLYSHISCAYFLGKVRYCLYTSFKKIKFTNILNRLTIRSTANVCLFHQKDTIVFSVIRTNRLKKTNHNIFPMQNLKMKSFILLKNQDAYFNKNKSTDLQPVSCLRQHLNSFIQDS